MRIDKVLFSKMPTVHYIPRNNKHTNTRDLTEDNSTNNSVTTTPLLLLLPVVVRPRKFGGGSRCCRYEGGCSITQGAVVVLKRCSSHEGCTNIVQRGGVCVTHGAKVKQCSHKGCANQSNIVGLCWKHGGKKKCAATRGVPAYPARVVCA